MDTRTEIGDGRGARVSGGPRQRLYYMALATIAMSLVGFVLALVFNWPSDFVLDPDSADSTVTMADFAGGTVTSIPLPPLLVLVLATFLVRRGDRWGTVAVVVLTLLGLLFTVGGLGEITSDNEMVPARVLDLAGFVYVIAGLALATLGVLTMLQRGPRSGDDRGPQDPNSGDESGPHRQP